MDKYEFFKKNYSMTREDIIFDIERTIGRVLERADIAPLHSDYYYSTLKSLLADFREAIKLIAFMNRLDDGWCYDWEVNPEGVSLLLEHYFVFDDLSEPIPLISLDQSFKIFTLEAKMLTVEEYAQQNKVEEVTVRQWIRRGKIRTAKKYGNEWRIPALTDIPKRGYTTARYTWSNKLIGLSSELEYLNDYVKAIFTQDDNDKKLFYVSLFTEEDEMNNNIPSEVIVCNSAKRERIELALISQPMVVYSPNSYDTIAGDIICINSDVVMRPR